MDSTDYSHDDSHAFAGFQSHLDGSGDNPNMVMMVETYEANGGGDDDPTSPRSESSMPPAPHGHGGYMPPSDLFKINEDNEEEEIQDDTLDNVEGAPWTVNWTGVAKDKLVKAMNDTKLHANSLYVAIETFIKEADAVHSEWSEIRRAEYAESQRLDEVEPEVHNATAGAAKVLAGRNGPTSP